MKRSLKGLGLRIRPRHYPTRKRTQLGDIKHDGLDTPPCSFLLHHLHGYRVLRHLQEGYIFSFLSREYLALTCHHYLPQRAVHTLPDKPPIISYGPPGRSAVTGHVATVFGCTGFLGRYLVSKLGAFPSFKAYTDY
jgi:hypothetical protein